MNKKYKNLVVAISGSGRTLKNILDQEDSLPFNVVGVVASRECSGLDYSRDKKIPELICDTTHSDDQALLGRFLGKVGCDFVALAGFIQIWPLQVSEDRPVLNIHPALLPKFGGKGMYGINVHRAVKESGVLLSGATVHLVTEAYDEGPILAQAPVQIFPEDSPEDIAKKVFDRECELYPKALAEFSQGLLNSEQVLTI